MNRSHFLALTGQFTQAIDAYRRAIKLRDDVVDVHYNLGSAMMQLRRWAGAAAANRRVVELQPDMTEAHVNLGDALVRQSRFTPARKAYEQAVKLDASLGVAHHRLALIHYHFRKFDAAWAEVETCRKIGYEVDPRFVEALEQARKVAAEAEAPRQKEAAEPR